jgi:hypothetical protein
MKLALALAAAVAATATMTAPAEAGGLRSDGTHAKSSYYRKGPQVRGYVARRGGYSYTVFDTINTYGNARSRYGSINSYRDPFSDRQTTSGPFDHGFFFDSGMAPRGGDSPYMN